MNVQVTVSRVTELPYPPPHSIQLLFAHSSTLIHLLRTPEREVWSEITPSHTYRAHPLGVEVGGIGVGPVRDEEVEHKGDDTEWAWMIGDCGSVCRQNGGRAVLAGCLLLLNHPSVAYVVPLLLFSWDLAHWHVMMLVETPECRVSPLCLQKGCLFRPTIGLNVCVSVQIFHRGAIIMFKVAGLRAEGRRVWLPKRRLSQV